MSFLREIQLQMQTRGYYAGDIADMIGSSTIHATTIMREPELMTVKELMIILEALQPNKGTVSNYLIGSIYR